MPTEKHEAAISVSETIVEAMTDVASSLLMVSSCLGAMAFPKMVTTAKALVEDSERLLKVAECLSENVPIPPRGEYGHRVTTESEDEDATP